MKQVDATPPTVSVIIPVHNAEATIGEQLDALCNQEDAPHFDVTVATNRCTDRTAEIARSFVGRATAIQVVDAPGHPSAAHARNVGVARSDGELLLFCDADDVVDSRWVHEIVRAQQSQGCDAIGGRLVVDRSALPHWLHGLVYDSMDGCCTNRIYGFSYAVTASMACTRNAFDLIGGFDENIGTGAGAEDSDFGIRLNQRGLTLGEAPEALVTYRPKSTVRALLMRSHTYSRNSEALAAKLGLADRQRSIPVIILMVKAAGYTVIVDRKADPRSILFRMAETFAQYSGRRQYRRAKRGAPEVPSLSDEGNISNDND